MAGNTFGALLRLTTFGESHGTAIGGVLDGCPPSITISEHAIQHELDRRRPGQSAISTPRKESDTIELLSGVFKGVSTGAPIAFVIKNNNAQSADYDHLKDIYRPSHADYTYQQKYGVRDYRGGGRSSARETASRVAAGAIAKAILPPTVSVKSYVSQVGQIKLEHDDAQLNLELIDTNLVRCPDAVTAEKMLALIEEMRDSGDTVGGVITCVIKGVPAGWGEPVFDKLHADLAKAMLSINAVKGFEIGSGFAGVSMRGSEQNDSFIEGFTTKSNNSGGIQGGISNGQDIVFRVAFKPVATIKSAQQTVDASGNEVTLAAKGRHDPCVLPRAVPIVDAMAHLVLADHYLRQSAITNLNV